MAIGYSDSKKETPRAIQESKKSWEILIPDLERAKIEVDNAYKSGDQALLENKRREFTRINNEFRIKKDAYERLVTDFFKFSGKLH